MSTMCCSIQTKRWSTPLWFRTWRTSLDILYFC
uniref:Uncharacterized protein n=1 Tax=Anguilla anguilla TaxID=7936 RepID=A0A0E9P5P4_ANGAN